FAASFGDVIVNFRDALKEGEKVTAFFNRISYALVPLVVGLKNVGGFIRELFEGKFSGSNGVSEAMDNLRERFEPMAGLLKGASRAWEGFLSVMRKVADFMRPLIDAVREGI